VKVINTTLWDQPEMWKRSVEIRDGATKTAPFAFEAGFLNLVFDCSPCRAEVHPSVGDTPLSSQCGSGLRQISTGTYDIRYQLGPDLEVWKRGIVITKGQTVGVKPF
jgi:hypothetical protein